MKDYFAQFGKPNIKIGGLAIWAHRRQFPDAKDYWDANWLDVSIHCGSSGSSVNAEGAIIHLSEIKPFLSDMEKLYTNLSGSAKMSCMEPYLAVELKAEKLGHIEMIVAITPDLMSEKHKFVFEIDQSYLSESILQFKSLLQKFPIIGKP